MSLELLPPSIRKKYEVHEWKHACAVLKSDFPKQWDDLMAILGSFQFSPEDVTAKGGNVSAVPKWFDTAFNTKGWSEKYFNTKIVVDETIFESPTHKVDCVKGKIAVEIEWNNKDPFFDRDLNNFRLLFDLRAISVGVIITKSDELVPLFKTMAPDTYKKFGASTTWMKKLLPRIEGGGGGGCPLLVFGITKELCNSSLAQARPQELPALPLKKKRS